MTNATGNGSALPDLLRERLAAVLGVAPVEAQLLQGGSTVDVLKIELADGTACVAKYARSGQTSHLEVERYMLAELAREGIVPVPAVFHGDDDLLVMEFLPSDGSHRSTSSQLHAAEILATLHARPRMRFGYGRDTVIGQLRQPNGWYDTWIQFFRDQRLLHMTLEGHAEGTIDDGLRTRLEKLAEQLDRYIDEPTHPALLHGDVWTGNVLASEGRITGLIDPAIYIGHPEIELAFITMFETFGEPFFRRYAEIRHLDRDFFELRREIYLIYPLLVHVRYWDRSYAKSIELILDRLGF